MPCRHQHGQEKVLVTSCVMSCWHQHGREKVLVILTCHALLAAAWPGEGSSNTKLPLTTVEKTLNKWKEPYRVVMELSSLFLFVCFCFDFLLD